MMHETTGGIRFATMVSGFGKSGNPTSCAHLVLEQDSTTLCGRRASWLHGVPDGLKTTPCSICHRVAKVRGIDMRGARAVRA